MSPRRRAATERAEQPDQRSERNRPECLADLIGNPGAVLRGWGQDLLERQIPERCPPSALADLAARPIFNHDQRRLLRAASRHVCHKVSDLIAHATEQAAGEPGAEPKQPLEAWLAVSLAFTFALHQDERMLSRNMKVWYLTVPDGALGERDCADLGDLEALPEPPDLVKLIADMVPGPRLPNSFALGYGFVPGSPITEDQLADVENKLADHYPAVVSEMMDYLRKRARRVYPHYGMHLVVDRTYFGSVAHSPDSDWDLDGYIHDDAEREAARQALPPERWADAAGVGPAHWSFRWLLPTRWKDVRAMIESRKRGSRRRSGSSSGSSKKKSSKPTESPVALVDIWPDELPDDVDFSRRFVTTNFLGRGIILMLDGPSGIPVLADVVPADVSERKVLVERMLPKLRRLIKAGVIRPRTLAADAGYGGPEVSRELLKLGIDPRIDLVDRRKIHQDEIIQDGYVSTFLMVRGSMSRRYGFTIRTQSADGTPLAEPVKEPIWEDLPHIRTDRLRRRLGFGCLGSNPVLADQVSDLEENQYAHEFATCGARHRQHANGEPWGLDEEPCRTGADGVLYWVYITGEGFENSRVTRNRPADGRAFRDTDVVRVDFGPKLATYDVPLARGGRVVSFRRDLAGIYRTPLSPRENPNVLADFRAVRGRIERSNGVLRQFSSMTRARVWGSMAGWHAWTAVLSFFLVALTNMECMHVFGKVCGLPDDLIEALVILVAGYNVERARVDKADAQREADLLLAAQPP